MSKASAWNATLKHKKEIYITDTYIDDVLQTTQIDDRWYNLTIAGGAGLASKFMTSDGFTKSVGNTFLYTTVMGGLSAYKVVAGVTVAIFCTGFDYNASTGLARWLFEESKTTSVLIGGTVEGLELAANGTAVLVMAKGLK